MSRLRILILAPFCDPEAVSMPYVAYSHAAALAELHDVTVVVESPVAEKVQRAKGPFCGIEVVRRPKLERFHSWVFRNIFRSNFSSQALTAFGYPFALHYEWQAWRQLRSRIFAGEFDLVLRLLPMSAVIPSPFAFFLRNGPIPFVIGPISGGLPFVRGFKQAENQREWISGLRKFHRYFPFARSTYRKAAAIIAASSQTYAEFAAYSDKMFFVPEPGIARSLCKDDARPREASARLEMIFVGFLIPCKACDLALRAAASLLKSGSAHLSIVGDGPERNNLEQLAKSLGIAEAVSFCGWVDHAEVLERMRASEILLFPSVRDFGAGVVFEALACGAVPVVADFGGPGDIVYPEVGRKVALTNEQDFVRHMEGILEELAHDRQLLVQMREKGMAYARRSLTWDAKAQRTTQVLNWVAGRGVKPSFPPPKTLGASRVRPTDKTVSRATDLSYGE
jgi:glycosyltransferase involved in cell wall biosynthesis